MSENLANAQSTGKTPGADPYTRKTITLRERARRGGGRQPRQGRRHRAAPLAVRIEHNPGHPAADANGYVKLPNVDMMVEMADMREANRSYEANLQIIKQAREMISMTIDLLRSSSMIDPHHARRSRRSAPACRRRRRAAARGRAPRRSAEAAPADFGAMLAQLAADAAEHAQDRRGDRRSPASTGRPRCSRSSRR